jgi:DNA gyrase subunit A
MSILRHEEITPDVRHGYLGMARDRRRQMGEESEVAEAQTPEQPAEPDEAEGDNGTGEAALTEEQFLDLAAREEFVLSVTQKGFGVRSSAYDYRITGRGGQGVNNMDLSRRRDAIVAVFPVGHNDQLMLVTDAGMVIRVPVNDIRIARRGSAGVVVFRVDDDERVVSVARLPEVAEENGDGSNGGEPNGHDPDGPGAGEPGLPPGDAASEEGPEGDER